MRKCNGVSSGPCECSARGECEVLGERSVIGEVVSACGGGWFLVSSWCRSKSPWLL